MQTGDRVRFTITADDGPGTSPYEVEREGIVYAFTEAKPLPGLPNFPGVVGIKVGEENYMVRRDQIL